MRTNFCVRFSVIIYTLYEYAIIQTIPPHIWVHVEHLQRLTGLPPGMPSIWLHFLFLTILHHSENIVISGNVAQWVEQAPHVQRQPLNAAILGSIPRLLHIFLPLSLKNANIIKSLIKML